MKYHLSIFLIITLITGCSSSTMGINPTGAYITFQDKVKKDCSKIQTTDEKCEPVGDIPVAPPALGEPDPGKVIIPIKRGQLAPFSGTLASPAAIASIIAQIEQIDQQIQIEVQRATKEQELKDNYIINNLKAEKERLQQEKDIMVQSRDDQIKLLTTELSKASNPKNELWFGLGIGTGVLVSVVAGIAIGAAVK